MTLREFLDLKGETASQFATRTGISQPYISRLVKRQRFPRPEIIEKIRVATNGYVTANDLMPVPASGAEAAA